MASKEAFDGGHAEDIFSPTIEFRGAITSEKSQQAIDLIRDLSHFDPEAELELKVDSRGGELQSCLNIAKALHHIPNPLKTVGESQVMSGAILLVALGDKGNRFAHEDTEFMIHQVQLTYNTEHTAMPELVREIKYWMRKNREFLRELSIATGTSIGDLQRQTQHDNFFGAEKAKELGIIDHIIPRVRRRSGE